MIIQLAEGQLRTKYGEFREVLFYDGQQESIALIMGEIEGAKNVLCRIHSSCIFGHYFNSIECDCQEQMNNAQAGIQHAGRGIIILLNQEGKGNGHFALLKSVEYKRKGVKQADAYEAVGFSKDARDFRAAGKILKALGVESVQLITDNPQKVKTMVENGVPVAGKMTASDF